jgi:hypothetical protein
MPSPYSFRHGESPTTVYTIYYNALIGKNISVVPWRLHREAGLRPDLLINEDIQATLRRTVMKAEALIHRPGNEALIKTSGPNEDREGEDARLLSEAV